MSTLRDSSFGVALLTFVAFAFALGMALSVCAMSGCASSAPAVTAAAAEAAYAAEQLRCVDQAETREQSRACRAEVDRRWGVDAGTREGGAR